MNPQTLKIGQAIGLAIAKDRARKNMTQGEYAADVGLPQSQLSRLESGRLTPTISSLVAIAEKTGITFKITITPQ